MDHTDHVAILRANEGECAALSNLPEHIARRVVPLFEFGPLTSDILERKYMKASATPTMTHIDRLAGRLGQAWKGRSALADGYMWPPDAHVENGEHVIAYMVRRLRAVGIPVIPVVGYDRWSNLPYRVGMQNVALGPGGQFCIRFDSVAFDDAAEPDMFSDAVLDMLDTLEIEASRCIALLDFGDISSSTQSVEKLISSASSVVELLREAGFRHLAIAGCSLPSSINHAVAGPNSAGSVLRKEMLIWQALRLEHPDLEIVSGDYGVRGPTTVEIHTKHANGKIRYAIKKEIFVVRGHSFEWDGGSHAQMRQLAEILRSSKHYLGDAFSWGDQRISQCAAGAFVGSPGSWIAIDTNHHLTFVVHEVEEFERDVVRASATKVLLSGG